MLTLRSAGMSEVAPMAFDPDFGKTGFARHLFRLRFRDLKLSQRAFAERFGLSYSVVRDAEQGAAPTRALRLIVAAIASSPGAMEAAARQAQVLCTCGDGDAYRSCAASALPGNGNSDTLTRARACDGTENRNGQA
ncbi:hypothetical protein [Novosphingobium sp. ERW19]|uniref:hypothetical protein n=1 Tax=Novosphingobium sp. ERW19 TaxID=2726186 RepID=UPI0014569AFB|nr:hypothetical protein [Novosphingobium sp. ERW19]NLR38534.1 hypothetical protein [Novosphingobium sp. ERW19]